MPAPLLYDLFQNMRAFDRQAGHRGIGTNEYLALLDALAGGYGFLNEAQFKEICTLLWCKPYHDRSRFEQKLAEALQSFYRQMEQRMPAEETVEKNKEQPTVKPREPAPTPPGRKDEPAKLSGKKEERPPAPKSDTVIIHFENAQPDRDPSGRETALSELEEQINRHEYLLEGNYFELTSRQLQQGMRSIRQPQPSRTYQELDLEATIEKAAQQGYLQDLVLRPALEFSTDLNILIDNGASMAAFGPFAEELVEVTAHDYDIQRQVYYFAQAPGRFVFLDPERQEGIPVEEISARGAMPLLILSDAGAATGTVDQERVAQTVEFLAKVRNHRIAWLNPMPRSRWKGTSADYISYYVSMFDANSREFGNVVKLFKAKLTAKTLF